MPIFDIYLVKVHMQDPKTYYKERLKVLKEEKSAVSRKLLTYSLLRLLVFLLQLSQQLSS